MQARILKRATVTLAMLGMALFLLAGCGDRSDAASATTTRAPTLVTKTPAGASSTATTAPTTTRAPVAKAIATLIPAAKAAVSAVSDQGTITFAVVGDDGTHGDAERQVAQMVTHWKPDFILNTGDAYYSAAGGYSTDKYDRAVGAYYCDYLKGVNTTGKNCAHGNADKNRFFPTLGNHDYFDAGVDNYLSYFDLPGSDFKSSSGNERYYDFVWGPVHFFSVDSNPSDPAGASADSKQGQWLKNALSKSASAWNIVFFHHPPYSSGASHGDAEWMQWPFKDWGVTAVLSGHEHLYERLQVGGLTYFVNGAGGGKHYQFKEQPEKASQARVASAWGAQKVTANDTQITFDFYTVDGKVADSYTIKK